MFFVNNVNAMLLSSDEEGEDRHYGSGERRAQRPILGKNEKGYGKAVNYTFVSLPVAVTSQRCQYDPSELVEDGATVRANNSACFVRLARLRQSNRTRPTLFASLPSRTHKL